jgi:glucuronoarabinoxylan endo-1,4-beta-xylanase
MKKNALPAALFILFAVSIVTCKEPAMKNVTMEVRYNENRQEIDGFGGSDAWASFPSGTAGNQLVKLLYSKTEGAGLTILRNRIPFRERLTGDSNPEWNDGFVVRKGDNTYNYTESGGVKTFSLNWNSWDLSGTKNLISAIKALGADGPEELVIMSTPWTPPNNRVTRWKEDVTGADGSLNGAINWSAPDIWGHLKKDKYNDYADLLADYAKNFRTNMGAALAVLSVQNEPNMKVGYESCYWTGNDIRDFLKVIRSRFPGKGVTLGAGGLGIMVPEYENFDVNFNAMIKPSLDDSQAAGVLTHIALHQYNGGYDLSEKAGAKEFPGITGSGRRFWQTEVSNTGGDKNPHTGTNTIDNAIYFARMIHFDLTLTQVNAFLYWWLWTNNDSNPNFPGALATVSGSTVTAGLRLYAMGQYARFIRPGWVRIDTDTEPAGLYYSAYKNPNSKEIAVVLINDTDSAVTSPVTLNGASFASLSLWRTSESEKLQPIGPQTITNGDTTVTLPAKSVSTLYGYVQ